MKAPPEKNPLLSSRMWLLEGFISLRAGGLKASVHYWQLALVLCHVGLANKEACFIKVQAEMAVERQASKMRVTVFYSLK